MDMIWFVLFLSQLAVVVLLIGKLSATKKARDSWKNDCFLAKRDLSKAEKEYERLVKDYTTLQEVYQQLSKKNPPRII